MAITLTNPVATVTLAGTAECITLPSTYSWVWVRNDASATVYISQTEDVGEGVAGTVAVPAGGAARLSLTGDSFYAAGTGAVQIVAANYTDCPFKSAPAASGGGSESVMTLIASVSSVGTTSKMLEGLELNAGDKYYFEGYYFINVNGYSKQYIFTEKVITLIELPMHSKIPFSILSTNGVPTTGDNYYLNINFNANGSLQLWAGTSGFTKLNIYKLN